MTNNKDQNEDIIKKLVQNSDLESPSDKFTDNIMNKLQKEYQAETIITDTSFNIWQLLLIVVPGLMLVAGTFYYYWHDFAAMFNFRYITNSFIPYIKELFGKVSDILSKQEFSSLLIIILLSVGFLMIIDSIIHLGKRMKSYLFII